jgi:hypothetical protein
MVGCCKIHLDTWRSTGIAAAVVMERMPGFCESSQPNCGGSRFCYLQASSNVESRWKRVGEHLVEFACEFQDYSVAGPRHVTLDSASSSVSIPQTPGSPMGRINLEEIRNDGKEPRKFAYLYADDKNPHPRIHQLEHFADNVTDSNLLEAVVVSVMKFKEIRDQYNKILEENGQLTKEHRQAIEDLAYEENFIPNKKGMLLFYHPQKHELRAREIHPPSVD